MATYQSFGVVGGAADLLLQDRYSDMSDNYALNPADLTRQDTAPTTAHLAAHLDASPARTDVFSPQLRLLQNRHSMSPSGTVSDPLLLYLDPALGGSAAAATMQEPYVGARSSSRSTASSTKTRSSGRSNAAQSKSTTPLTAHSPDGPAEPLSPPPAKRARKAKPKSVAVKVEPKEEDKRDQFLERNRLAASKCRKKKKAWMTELEEAKQAVTQQHDHLRNEYNRLVNEVGELKNILMSHAGCQNPNIDKWIENEAKRFVESTNRRLERAGYGSTPSRVPDARHKGRAPSATSPTGSDQNRIDGTLCASDTNPFARPQTQTSAGHELDLSGLKMDPADAEYSLMPLSMFPSVMDDLRI